MFLCPRWQQEAGCTAQPARAAEGVALTFTPPLLWLSINFSLFLLPPGFLLPVPHRRPATLPPSQTFLLPLHPLVFIGMSSSSVLAGGGGARKTYGVHYMEMFLVVHYCSSRPCSAGSSRDSRDATQTPNCSQPASCTRLWDSLM